MLEKGLQIVNFVLHEEHSTYTTSLAFLSSFSNFRLAITSIVLVLREKHAKPSEIFELQRCGLRIVSDGKTEHMMLAGAVGDFTKSLVSNPPSLLWARQVHFAGLPYLVNMYDRVLLVATGSGICVYLSFLLQPCSAEVSVLWVANGIEQNFGKEIKEMISGHPKEKVMVHDTAVLGRPNVSQMSVGAAKKWGADVVIVTSNPEGSRDVVNACKGAGIPAFGPIWDS